MTHGRVQIQCSVRLATMQEYGHRSNRDMRCNQGKSDNMPNRPVKQAVGGEIQQSI
jgi:hypothetical protein